MNTPTVTRTAVVWKRIIYSSIENNDSNELSSGSQMSAMDSEDEHTDDSHSDCSDLDNDTSSDASYVMVHKCQLQTRKTNTPTVLSDIAML